MSGKDVKRKCIRHNFGMWKIYLITVKPVLRGHPQDPPYWPLNRGVCLVQVHFAESKEETLVFTEAGVCLIRGLLNTGFTVDKCFILDL